MAMGFAFNPLLFPLFLGACTRSARFACRHRILDLGRSRNCRRNRPGHACFRRSARSLSLRLYRVDPGGCSWPQADNDRVAWFSSPSLYGSRTPSGCSCSRISRPSSPARTATGRKKAIKASPTRACSRASPQPVPLAATSSQSSASGVPGRRHRSRCGA